MHVLEAQQFSREWLEGELFPLAEQFASGDLAAQRPLRDRRLFWLFYETSTRTRVSFESAMALLGGSVSGLEVSTHPEELVSERLEDRIRVLNDYGYDFILLRYHQEGGARRAAAASQVPIINAGDGAGQHPTQAMLDLFTMRQEIGRLDGLSVALVGDLTFERSTNSLAYLLARFKEPRLYLVSPETLRIRSDVREYLDQHDVRYTELRDLREVAGKVDVIYVTRAHTGRLQHALRFDPGEGFYSITREILELLPKHGIVMHPLPRGDELPPELDDDPRIACFREARNGLFVRMALLSLVAPEAAALMRILVTGGAGFIGSHLCDALLVGGHQVMALDDLSTGNRRNLIAAEAVPGFELIDGTILDAAAIERLMSRADLCYHLAAAVGVHTILEQPLRSLLTNMRGTELVLEAADRQRVPIVIASTSEVYGKNDSGPLAEDADRILGSSQVNRWHYATAKAVDEALALSYAQETGLQTIVVRFFNTVGPRQSGRYGMVVPRLASQALAGVPMTVYGDGQQTRCFTYVRDTVRCLQALAETPAAWGQVFNIGQPTEISIVELAEKLRDLAGSRSEIVLVPYSEAYGAGFEDMRRRLPDVTKLRATIGFAPDTPLDETLRAILEAVPSLAPS